VTIRLRAEDEPAKTRLDYWQHVLESALAPYQLCASGDTLRSQIHQTQIGAVSVLDFHMSALQGIRTPDLIRKSDRGMVKVDLGIRGRGRYEQDGRQSVLAPGEFHLIDLSRPSHVAIEESQEISVVMFPRTLLPVREKDVRELTTVRFSAQDPYASLVASLGRELVRHLDAYDSSRDARIGTAFLDLLALAVATRLDRVATVPAESRQQAMMVRAQAFIEHHLGDPDLSPGMIAAAHHISVRTLHKLYEARECTVTGSIRRRRLERCRQDLLDLRQPDRPVHAVGARWGFRDAAAFSRAFRATYGLPPGEYRAVHRSRAGKTGVSGGRQ
jgi:AraC-like DNA-binding protein